MKPIPAKLKGKRIEDVLLRDSAGTGGPQHQLILCFEDGTSFEFWSSNSFHPAGGLDPDTREDIESRDNGMITVASIAMDEQQPVMALNVYALTSLLHEVSYLQECIAEDLVAEARRSFPEAFECLEAAALPESMQASINRVLYDASLKTGHGERDLPACQRLLQNLRRRLANQLALTQSQATPYSLDVYPVFIDAV